MSTYVCTKNILYRGAELYITKILVQSAFITNCVSRNFFFQNVIFTMHDCTCRQLTVEESVKICKNFTTLKILYICVSIKEVIKLISSSFVSPYWSSIPLSLIPYNVSSILELKMEEYWGAVRREITWANMIM